MQLRRSLPYVNESPRYFSSGRWRVGSTASPVDSVRFAVEGFRYAFLTQRNLRIQCAVGTAALMLGVVLRLPFHEFALIAALTALVLFAELMNTAIEATLDFHAGAEFDLAVKQIKDIAAASVLTVSLGAAVLGATIFLHALAPALPL